MAPTLIFCGVAGAGKSSLAALVSQRLARPFLEGDDLHPPANRAKMAAGTPLTDVDRAPWLDAIAAVVAGWAAAGIPGVVACSALKRAYRDRLRAAGEVRFVFLAVDPPLAYARIAARQGHYMPASLAASQFAALEPPGADEGALHIDAALPPAEQLAVVLTRFTVMQIGIK